MEPTIPAVNLRLQFESVREEIDASIRQVLERQSFILGPEVQELEQAVARAQDCSHAVGCAAGSDALLLSLMALGIGPGDPVLVPAFTFFSTASSVVRAGATPVFVDIDPRTFHISPEAVRQALASHNAAKPVRAVIPVHLYGQCANMDALSEMAKQYDLHMIEDAAQAILARYGRRAAGSLGDCGCFSFYPTKNLGGAGDGGMITTQDASLAERLRALRDHGSVKNGSVKKYTHACLGINSRLDTLQAAVLIVKLRHLEEWTELRRKKASFYRAAFSDTGLSHPSAAYPTREAPVVLPYVAPDAGHVYHQFTVRAYRRDELARHLATKGIESAVYYPIPLHLQEAFSYLRVQPGSCPESERAAGEVLSLPLYPEITAEQQSRVVEEIKRFYSS